MPETPPVPTPTTPVPVPPPAPVPTPPAPGATPPAAPAAPVAPARPDGVSDAEWVALGDPGKAAIVRERQNAATATAELAALRKEIDDSKKTTEQRAADDLIAARAEATSSAAKALRYEVAAEKGIPLTASGRLVGATREEIAADADRFLTDFPNLLVPPTRTPAPDLSQGPRGPGPASADDLLYESLYPTPSTGK